MISIAYDRTECMSSFGNSSTETESRGMWVHHAQRNRIEWQKKKKRKKKHIYVDIFKFFDRWPPLFLLRLANASIHTDICIAYNMKHCSNELFSAEDKLRREPSKKKIQQLCRNAFAIGPVCVCVIGHHLSLHSLCECIVSILSYARPNTQTHTIAEHFDRITWTKNRNKTKNKQKMIKRKAIQLMTALFSCVIFGFLNFSLPMRESSIELIGSNGSHTNAKYTYTIVFIYTYTLYLSWHTIKITNTSQAVLFFPKHQARVWPVSWRYQHWHHTRTTIAK